MTLVFHWHEAEPTFGSFWLSFYRNYLTKALCHGLNDFPMNKFVLALHLFSLY